MLQNHLVEIYNDLDDTKKISPQRVSSACQNIRLNVVRRLTLHPTDKKNFDPLMNAFNSKMNKHHNLEQILRKEFDFTIKDQMQLKPVSQKATTQAVNFKSKHKNIKEKFIIHGSHADNSCTEYSDFDCSLFVSIESFHPRRQIEFLRQTAAINRNIHMIDDTSHHGVFIFYEHDFLYYPEPFMPISAWSNGVSNFDEINIYTREAHDLSFQNLMNAISSTFNFIHHIENTEHHLKKIISTYFISLVIYTQFVSGQYHSKQDIFKNTKMFCFKERHFETFHALSNMRKLWKRDRSYYFLNMTDHIKEHLIDIMNSLEKEQIMYKLEGNFK